VPSMTPVGVCAVADAALSTAAMQTINNSSRTQTRIILPTVTLQ
jgi:hypothetical protein